MKEIKLKDMKFEMIDGKLYCREIYENGMTMPILIEGSPTDFIKKIALLKDGITQEDLNKMFDFRESDDIDIGNVSDITDEMREDFFKQIEGKIRGIVKCDIRIRRVRVLGDRARKKAEKMKLKEDDLVIIRTYVSSNSLPIYDIEKIEGSPIEYLTNRYGVK